jgi:hypothetical protein
MADGTDEDEARATRVDGRVGGVGDGGEEHPAGFNCIPFLLSFIPLFLLGRWIHFVVHSSPAEGRELVPFVSAFRTTYPCGINGASRDP